MGDASDTDSDDFFVEHLWSIIEHTFWPKIKSHPFIRDIITGTLSKERAECYDLQDRLFLHAFGEGMVSLAPRMKKPVHTKLMQAMGRGCLQDEEQIQREQAHVLPNCLLYTSYVTAIVHTKPAWEGLVCFLPCWWSYERLAVYMLEERTKLKEAKQEHKMDLFCESFIENYSSVKYAQSTGEVLKLVEDVASQITPPQRKGMEAHFVRCFEMEWMFWDACYHLHHWPLSRSPSEGSATTKMAAFSPAPQPPK